MKYRELETLELFSELPAEVAGQVRDVLSELEDSLVSVFEHGVRTFLRFRLSTSGAVMCKRVMEHIDSARSKLQLESLDEAHLLDRISEVLPYMLYNARHKVQLSTDKVTRGLKIAPWIWFVRRLFEGVIDFTPLGSGLLAHLFWGDPSNIRLNEKIETVLLQLEAFMADEVDGLLAQ